MSSTACESRKRVTPYSPTTSWRSTAQRPWQSYRVTTTRLDKRSDVTWRPRTRKRPALQSFCALRMAEARSFGTGYLTCVSHYGIARSRPAVYLQKREDRWPLSGKLLDPLCPVPELWSGNCCGTCCCLAPCLALWGPHLAAVLRTLWAGFHRLRLLACNMATRTL